MALALNLALTLALTWLAARGYPTLLLTRILTVTVNPFLNHPYE